MKPTLATLHRLGLQPDRMVLLLVLAAAAPYVPAAWQFVEHGVPDQLFTGDGATLEIRTLHAAAGEQFVGPYSRFVWNHPGPMFFYLALPVYELFGERGPALNLFVLLANCAIAVAVVLAARRLRGAGFAWLVAGLLAVFELVALPFVRTGEWNPVSPLLPLLLVSFWAARISLGAFGLLPAFVLIASAIVQTHIGYLPEVAALTAVAVFSNLARFAVTEPPAATWPSRRIAIAAGIVLLVCWLLPLYESATNRPGNLKLLIDFFSASNPDRPPWEVVFQTLFSQLATLPVAIVRSLPLLDVPLPGPMFSEAIALAAFGLVLAAGYSAWRRRDAVLGVLAAVAVVEIAVAIAALRGVRGEVLDYLALWIAVPGFMAVAAIGAWVVQHDGRWQTMASAGVATVLLVLGLISPGVREAAFRERNPAAEQFASEVEAALRSRNLTPVVRIASSDIWPTAAGVILHLRKQRAPFYIEPSWGFMFGPSLVDPGGERPRLLIGSRSLDDQARVDAKLSPVAAVGDVVAYIDSSGSLDAQRIHQLPKVTAFAGVDRNPALVTDGEIPQDGTTWDSARSVILRSAESSITVGVPRADSKITGMFVSVDGNDLYRVRCGDRDLEWTLGVRRIEEGLIGMQVRRLIDDEIAGCQSVTIAPVSGDGFYSIGEVGFLK